MFEEFQNLDLFPVNAFDVVMNLLVALVCGVIISLVYRLIYKGPNYSTTYVNALVMLTMITSLVILVIGNNLARAFGLVGAMSIIRFRTVIKDTRDIAFVFLALAAGMAAGTGYHVIALAGTMAVILSIVALYWGNFGSLRSHDLLLRFSITPDERGSMLHEKVFREYLKKHSLLNINTRQNGEILELSFFVRLKSPERNREFVQRLAAVEGIEGVSLIALEETAEA